MRKPGILAAGILKITIFSLIIFQANTHLFAGQFGYGINNQCAEVRYCWAENISSALSLGANSYDVFNETATSYLIFRLTPLIWSVNVQDFGKVSTGLVITNNILLYGQDSEMKNNYSVDLLLPELELQTPFSDKLYLILRSGLSINLNYDEHGNLKKAGLQWLSPGFSNAGLIYYF